jgi:hypothetical protein
MSYREAESPHDDAARTGEETAGYMELDGADKDADCNLVEVRGGVSSELGCCNLFDPDRGAVKFTCGTCGHVRKVEDEDPERS